LLWKLAPPDEPAGRKKEGKTMTQLIGFLLFLALASGIVSPTPEGDAAAVQPGQSDEGAVR
jgi:hypothetical protein